MTKRHIYVIDDEDPIRRSTRLMLTVRGYEVATFESGTGFLEVARALRPGAVLLDIRMPVMDGIEMARTAARAFPSLRILLMTGYAEQRERADNLAAVIVDVVSKPFSLPEIRAAVTRALAA